MDAVVLATGSTVPRSLMIEGSDLQGVTNIYHDYICVNKSFIGPFCDGILDSKSKAVIGFQRRNIEEQMAARLD